MQDNIMEIKMTKAIPGMLDEETREDFVKRGYDPNHVFILPFKMKNRFESIVCTLVEFMNHSNAGKTFGICEELDFELKQLCRSIVYLINSTSYRTGSKYFDFDKMEIDNKLGRKRGD